MFLEAVTTSSYGSTLLSLYLHTKKLVSLKKNMNYRDHTLIINVYKVVDLSEQKNELSLLDTSHCLCVQSSRCL
uniref:Uncharacterized protein n=1 Tax=Arion vulgaris TaxID=1028688 RepID=A0A0B6ZU53_9EUPU